jgi:hypothetical protein
MAVRRAYGRERQVNRLIYGFAYSIACVPAVRLFGKREFCEDPTRVSVDVLSATRKLPVLEICPHVHHHLLKVDF